MGTERRTGVAAVTLTVLLGLGTAGCGDAKDAARSASSPVPSSSAASSPTASDSASATPAPSSGVGAGHPGRLWLVPGDGAGRCTTRHPLGYACALDDTTAYRFQPERLRSAGVTEAVAEHDDQQGWVVRLTFDPAGRRTVARVTTRASVAREYVLLMLGRGGPVISAPQVLEPIRGGEVQISGLRNQAVATRIVNQITKSAR